MMGHHTDVLIIGGGMAGLSAAIHAKLHEPKAQVTILVAGVQGAGGCSRKTHGINASMNCTDSWEAHAKDTMIGGGYINNPKLVEILVREIPERLRELESWGMEFTRKMDGSYAVGTYGGSSTARSIHYYDMTGKKIIDTLIERATILGCHVMEHRWGVKLIVDGSQCIGCIALNKETNEIEAYYSKSTILATGGGACVYPISTISNDKLASGILMAFEAGASLLDMEMVQFHPTGLVQPGSSGHGEIMEEELRTWGGKLLNKDGNRFMPNYDNRDELATRDIVARSSYLEIIEGRGTKNGGVILDLTSIDRSRILARFPLMVKRLRNYGVDLMTQNKVEISPTAHYLMGGVRIDKNCQSDIQGLFVCGEDAGGIDGGNRLGGNGVAGTLVFGCRAGRFAVEYANTVTQIRTLRNNDLMKYYRFDEGEIKQIESKLKTEMWINVGLVREEKGLMQTLDLIMKLRDQIESKNPFFIKATEDTYSNDFIRSHILVNKLLLAEIITTAALARGNSVGAHYRLDAKIEEKTFNVLIEKQGNDGILVAKLAETPSLITT